MLYDIKIDFAGASGSSDIQDVGNYGFNVVNGTGVNEVILTTSNPRLLPTSGSFAAVAGLQVINTGYSIGTDAFRIEVWFYVPSNPSPFSGRIVELPGDMRLTFTGSPGVLNFTSLQGAGYTEMKNVSYASWHKLVILRQGSQKWITAILDGQTWFTRIDASNYTSQSTLIGKQSGLQLPGFIGQIALFHLQTDTSGQNPAGRVEPPRASLILSPTTTRQVEDGNYTGEAPYLVRSALGPTGPVAPGPYEEWDLLPDFSTGLDIPRVRVHARGAPADYIPTANVGTVATNEPPTIWLSWEGSLQSHEWMNYDPHYFLFYRGNRTKGFYNPNKRNGHFSGWIHPANTSLTSAQPSMFTNFAGSSSGVDFGSYPNDYRASEWKVPLEKFTPLNISGQPGASRFDPWSYYHSAPGWQFPAATFPVLRDSWNNFVAPLGKKCRSSVSAQSNYGIKGCLYLRFCIVIRDPLQPGKPIFGPMSESVMIYPRVGQFSPGADWYYYAWGASIKS